MRVLKKTAKDDFRVKAYAGTNGVLLAFDIAERRRKGLLGFAAWQKEDGAKKWQPLLNSLTFDGRAHTIPEWGKTPSDIAPLQKFRWQDYDIDPGTKCKYRVAPVYGTPDNPDIREPLEFEVTTNDGQPKGHHVIFNRAVAASQAFGRRFPDLDALLSKKKSLPIEDWPAAPREWLQHGLLDQIGKFIARAKDSNWAIDVAIYEYELAAIVDAVNAAHKRGAKVRILYHGKVNDKATAENEHSLAKIPAAKKRARVTSKIFHNKFIVLSKVGGSNARVPQAVLCGSTNFTENGVYRQANVVHTCDVKPIAELYATVFQQVWDNPADVGAARKWITANNALSETEELIAGFSPRTGKGDLTEFIRTIRSARRDVLFATAFKLPEDVLDALLGAPHDDILRYGIQNSKSRITGYHADRTAEFAATALLPNGIEGWVREGLRQQRGNLLVHLKAIVVDFTSDSPTVISGSHNLSLPASNGNDENYLIIRNNRDLADRYGIELMRFYEHYRFRHYAKLLNLKEVRPLEGDDTWADAYYEPGNLKSVSRQRFSGR